MKKSRRHLYLFLLGTFAILFLNYQFSIINSASASGPEAEREARLLVKYKQGHLKPTAGGRRVETIEKIGLDLIQYASRQEASKAAHALKANPAVLYAEVNTPSVKPMATPNDPQFGSQWHLSKISAPTAWDYQQGTTSTTIAIVDTGVDGTHADLSGKVLAGRSFVEEAPVNLAANSDSDNCGHGTAVAGLATAKTNNGVGVAGVDWQAKILPVRVIDTTIGCQAGFIEDVVEAILYATDMGAKILNISLAAFDYSQALRDAVTYAKNQGSIVVAAAGNSAGRVLYPAAFPEAIAVGSTDSNDNQASFSPPGPELDLVAPGVSLRTTCTPGGTDFACAAGDPYLSLTGTSASAPLVSGALGLALARNPGMVGSDFMTAAQGGVDKVAGMGGANFSNNFGYGRLNAFKILWAFQDYQAQFSSQNGYPAMVRSGSYNFQINFLNTGKSTWVRDDPFYPVNLGTDRGKDRIPGWIREDRVSGNPSGWIKSNRIRLSQASVPPGQTGTFSFWMTAPSDKAYGVYREYFRPVTDNWSWLVDCGCYWEIWVPAPSEQYNHRYVGQNFHETTIKRGQTMELILTVQNTGIATWQRGTVNLGTDRARDRIPGWVREGGNPSGWLKENRILMEQQTVAPGGFASFRFYLTTPPDKAFGTFREYFRLVADQITWLEDYGIYWEITVVP